MRRRHHSLRLRRLIAAATPLLAVWDDLVYHEYGMPTSQEECDSLGVTCQIGNSVVLRNHGLLTVGESIQGALRRMYMLERACEVEVIARGMN